MFRCMACNLLVAMGALVAYSKAVAEKWGLRGDPNISSVMLCYCCAQKTYIALGQYVREVLFPPEP